MLMLLNATYSVSPSTRVTRRLSVGSIPSGKVTSPPASARISVASSSSEPSSIKPSAVTAPTIMFFIVSLGEQAVSGSARQSASASAIQERVRFISVKPP